MANFKNIQIPRYVLPEVRSSSEIYAEVSGIDGLNGILIAGIAGDQQAALYGQRCYQSGMTKNTYGTGCFMLQNTGTRAVPSSNRLVTTIAWTIGGTPSTRSKAVFSSEAPWCSGCVTAWASFANQKKWRPSQNPCRTTEEFTLSPRS